MNEMINQALQQLRNDLIDELNKIIGFLQKSDRMCRGTMDIQSACEDINTMLNGLKLGNPAVWNQIAWIITDQGDLKKIAALNNWENEYLQIKQKIEDLSAKYHILEKQDASRFAGIVNGNHTDASTFAGCPGRFTLSEAKWKEIQTLFQLSVWGRFRMNRHKAQVREFICYGDTQPAVVVSVNPLLVAAYADEMDAVVLLRFPQEYAETYGLQKFDRLITVNTYARSMPEYSTVRKDIFVGPNYLHRYINFAPNIADFLSDETAKLQKHKEGIPNSIWSYTSRLGQQYLFNHPKLARKGFWFL